MILWHKNSWQNTIGLLITIRNGSFNESEKQRGYTHFAEHLMFSGTEATPRAKLRDRQYRTLNRLEATTSREEIKLSCYFDLVDFDQAVDILREMIFSWRCDKRDFKEEKQYVLTEMKEYFSSPAYYQRKAIFKILPLDKNEPLGDITAIRKIKFSEVKKIKKYWCELLKKSTIDVTVIGEKLLQPQIKRLDRIFSRPGSRSIVSPKPNVELLKSKNVWALVVKNGNYHLNNLLFDRILYWRWYQSTLHFEYEFIQLQNMTSYNIYNSKLINAKQACDSFCRPIGREEFISVKKIFLIFLRQMLDTVDIIDSLWWWSDFMDVRYGCFPLTEPKKIYQYFQKLSYGDFKKFVTNLQKQV